MTDESRKVLPLDENYAEVSNLHMLNSSLLRAQAMLETLLGGPEDAILRKVLEELFYTNEKVKNLKWMLDIEKNEVLTEDRERRRAFLLAPPDMVIDRVARHIHFRGEEKGQSAWDALPESDRAAAREHARNAIAVIVDYN